MPTYYTLPQHIPLAYAQGISQATRLHFGFYSEARQDSGDVSGLRTIGIPQFDKIAASEHDIFCQIVKEHQVPQSLR